MICQTLKNGVECSFMKQSGCGYNGGKCYTIVESCDGCNRVQDFETGRFCSSYAEPIMKWKNGQCNFATHLVKESTAPKKVVNALKASKRKATGKM